MINDIDGTQGPKTETEWFLILFFVCSFKKADISKEKKTIYIYLCYKARKTDENKKNMI